MNKHTEGLVRLAEAHEVGGDPIAASLIICNAAGTSLICTMIEDTLISLEECQANARRFVATWNAMLPIPTETIEQSNVCIAGGLREDDLRRGKS